ncbi:MAG: hypothetical protein CMI53_03740 [Parcubacteria group bacterium]|nr:hypothetical protein [Parcubacteria group bacterium]
MKRTVFSLIFLLTFVFFSSDALATTIFSPLLEIEVDPGITEKGVVKVFNETDAELFLTATVEPFTAGDESGQPLYLPPEAKHNYLDWFDLEEDLIIILPNQLRVVPFNINVPADAVPGGYYAVIFWGNEPSPAVGDIAVSIRGKVGTLIFLRVKGEATEIGEVLEFRTEPIKNIFWQLPINFVTRFSNNGNVHLKPTGTIELDGWFGENKIFPVNQDERFIIPQTVRRFQVVWGQEPIGNFWENFIVGFKQEFSGLTFGKYTATLKLNFGLDTNQELTDEIIFWILPYHLFSVLLIVIIFLGIFIKINKRIKKLKNKSSVPLPEKDNNEQ